MDADRFDSLVKALSLSAARRGFAAGLLGGGLANLAGLLQGDARSRRGDRELTAEKRKKKKKKKKRKNPQNPQPQDQAPTCTADACPLPPNCSQSALESCANPLRDAMIADAEPCRAVCSTGNSDTCQACLRPVVEEYQPRVQACVVQSCDPIGVPRALAQADPRVQAESAWWRRLCDRPCCPNEFYSCVEDLDHEFLACFGAALFSCFGGPACGLAMLGCAIRAAYNNTRCHDRYGCVDWGGCNEDGTCCAPRTHACSFGGCCHNADKCCARSPTGCCPGNSQCMETGIPCCSNCG